MGTLVNYSYWKWEGVLNKNFCQSALEEIDWAASEQGTIVVEHTTALLDIENRRTDIIWQDPMSPMGCVAHCYINQANASAGWGYILNSQESTQFGRYKSADEGHYGWHMDSEPPQNGVQRKLTCVILLNDPSEFEGGVLQLKGMEDEVILKGQGDIVVFPSFIEHRVTPVTKGVRYSAVTWAGGPSFR